MGCDTVHSRRLLQIYVEKLPTSFFRVDVSNYLQITYCTQNKTTFKAYILPPPKNFKPYNRIRFSVYNASNFRKK